MTSAIQIPKTAMPGMRLSAFMSRSFTDRICRRISSLSMHSPSLMRLSILVAILGSLDIRLASGLITRASYHVPDNVSIQAP